MSDGRDTQFLQSKQRKLIGGCVPGEMQLYLSWDNNEHDGDVYWINWRVIEPCVSDSNGLYYLTDDSGFRGDNVTQNPDEAEPIVYGFIKWDGCCQWWGECVHTDDPGQLSKLCDAIASVYKHAEEIFGGWR